MNERRFLTDVPSEPGRMDLSQRSSEGNASPQSAATNFYAWAALFTLMPAASRRAATLSVRSQLKLASVRPK